MKIVHCVNCNLTVNNDEVALNVKILGNQISMIRCYQCLSDVLGCDETKLENLANYYKSSGCTIFQRIYTY